MKLRGIRGRGFLFSDPFRFPLGLTLPDEFAPWMRPICHSPCPSSGLSEQGRAVVVGGGKVEVPVFGSPAFSTERNTGPVSAGESRWTTTGSLISRDYGPVLGGVARR